MLINDLELKQIYGGFKWQIVLIFGGIFTFLAGILDGIMRPLRCN